MDVTPGDMPVGLSGVPGEMYEEEIEHLSRKQRRALRRNAQKHQNWLLVRQIDSYTNSLQENKGAHGRVIHFNDATLRKDFVKPSDSITDMNYKVRFARESMEFSEKLKQEYDSQASDLEENAAKHIAEALELAVEETEKRQEAENARVYAESHSQLLADQLARHEGAGAEGKGKKESSLEDQVLSNSVLELLADPEQAPDVSSCLRILETLAHDRVTVFPTAYESAKEIDGVFNQTPRLMRLLARLAVQWIPRVIEFGDTEARKVFTANEYAANESETVERCSALKSLRSFLYRGKPLDATRHLRIGVTNNKQSSIRIYFAWIAEEKRVVIAYCGEHLPTMKRKH